MKIKRFLLISTLAIVFLLALIFFIRLFSEIQLDDVSPRIQCDEELLEKADIYFVIPRFNSKAIFENQD